MSSSLEKIARGLKKIKEEAEEKTKMAVKPHSPSDLNQIIAEMPSREKTVMANQPSVIFGEGSSKSLIGEEKFIVCEVIHVDGYEWIVTLISLDDIQACMADISVDPNSLPRYRISTIFLRRNFDGVTKLLNKLADALDNIQIEAEKKKRALAEEAEAQAAKSFDEDPFYGSW